MADRARRGSRSDYVRVAGIAVGLLWWALLDTGPSMIAACVYAIAVTAVAEWRGRHDLTLRHALPVPITTLLLVALEVVL